MVAASRWQRSGQIAFVSTAGPLILAGVLFVGFGLLTAHLYFWRERNAQDDQLIQELQNATLLEPDPLPGWPQWRGPRRDGVTAASGLLLTWPKDGPRVVWRAGTGSGYSSVSVAAGRAYTLFDSDDNQEVVVCWDAATGDEKWRFSYPSDFKNDYGGTRSTPTVDGDRVYTLGGKGQLYCLDTVAGKEVWHVDLLREFHAKNPHWGTAASPLIEGDSLFLNPGGPDGNSLLALNKMTGKVVWNAHDYPASYSSPIAVGSSENRQIIFFTENCLVGVAPGDGRLLWSYPWITEWGVNAATPLWFQAQAGGKVIDYLFITSGYDRGCALLKVLAEPGGGMSVRRVYENNQLRCRFDSPVRMGDCIYGISDSGRSDPGGLTCMDLRTGEVRWREKKFATYGSLLAADGHLIVLGENGNLGVVQPNPREYTELSLFRVFRQREKNWATPALANSLLYVRNGDEILCLDLHK